MSCHPFQSQLQDILSHQRLVDSVVEKAQGVLAPRSNSEVAAAITDITARYEKMTSTTKVMASVFLSVNNCDTFIQNLY